MKLLNSLRKDAELYEKLKDTYGYTIGLWPLKKLYLKHIGIKNNANSKRLKLLGLDECNKVLSNMIRSGKPFMLARYGSSEFRAIMNKKDFHLVCFYSGFFPQDDTLRDKFIKTYLDSSKSIDIFLTWNYRNHFINEVKLIKRLPNIKYLSLTIDVGCFNEPWIKELEGKKALVIHPFKSTIEKQMKKRKELGILPKLKSIEVIRAVQTIAGNNDPRFKDWFDALDYMKKEIDKKDFDIAIIGCGSYGLPLAAHVKSLGKQAIHLAGKTQLLFGIRGKRWDNNLDIPYTKDWISPLPEDTPKNHIKIEGGCYW